MNTDPKTARTTSTSRTKMGAGFLAAAFLMGPMASTAAAGDFEQPLATITDPGGDPWEFYLGTYGYLPWVKLETAAGTEVDLTPGDLIENMNMVFFADMEIRKGKWGLGADFIYIDLDFDLPSTTLRDMQISEWLITPKLSYRAWEGDWGFFDFQAGLRYTWVDLQVRGLATPGNQQIPIVESGTADIWDATIGFRGRYHLNDRWYFGYYAEVGAGDSDFIGQGIAALGYQFACVDVYLGFRYIHYDFSDSAPLSDEKAYGPQIGFMYQF